MVLGRSFGSRLAAVPAIENMSIAYTVYKSALLLACSQRTRESGRQLHILFRRSQSDAEAKFAPNLAQRGQL
jgi:hypothetical protein